MDHIRALERELARVRRLLEASLRFVVPVVLLAALLVFVYLREPDDWKEVYTLMLVFTFTPAGKFTASVFVSRGFSVPETVLVLGSIDVIVGLFLVWNFPLLYAIPRLGVALQRLETRSHATLKDHRWIRRTAFFGLALFVAIPLQGTGAVTGSILGRLLGMGPLRTIGAIAIGGYGGVAAVAGASEGIRQVLRQSLGGGLALLVVAVTAVVILAIAWKRRSGPGKARKGKPHKSGPGSRGGSG